MDAETTQYRERHPEVIRCAKIFQAITHLPCTLTTASGKLVAEYGYGCESCTICRCMGVDSGSCLHSHGYATEVAVARFGGKYIYVGPTGMTYFVAPILEEWVMTAKITVGPFLMVDRTDYLDVEGTEALGEDAEALARLEAALSNVPVLQAEDVQNYADLLFLAVGFLNEVRDYSRLVEAQSHNEMQTKISGHLITFKAEEASPPYPLAIETAILEAVAEGDKSAAQMKLNEMFGYLFFSTSGDLPLAKTRIYELLVLIARTAMKHGAGEAHCLDLTHGYFQMLPTITSMDDLCIWLSKITSQFIDSVFASMDTKHPNVIQTAVQYIRSHYSERLTLEGVASQVFLSPAYFSRIFKEETGHTFVVFLNEVRIGQSKRMLRNKNNKLVDISARVGFEDQSYFTKVFKKQVNMTPMQYRKNYLERVIE